MHKATGRAEHQDTAAQAIDRQTDHKDGPMLQEAPLATATDTMTRDVVLDGCQERTWTLDPAEILSFSDESRRTEVFRTLRSRLYQLQKSSPLKSILIASATPAEGRSFVAANLAQVMALQPECKVLLIDGDLRRPHLHKMLGTSPAPGLSEYLLQEVEEFTVMQKGSADNLFFIPSGRSMPGQTELIGNGRLKSLIDKLEPIFDWIIVDSSPALPTSDAWLLADYLDGILMVVRSNFTPFDVVQKACEKFREQSLVGVVLNEVAESKGRKRS